ncbi:hypothetical protein [Pinibacter soli]|uniref:Uncharacterized protein n=1 Tax=Pinibacter soli TaxID=3044211 RepID=A0ABT6RI44_9BACT|nr:hypothetical protein [Pinibacter soli]MDI3322235.1 hypothetical protein [Pinibacter soli]
MINATKDHDFSANADMNLFTEYAIYPDLIYKPGRKQVLLHFLEMKRIFKTKEFYEKYETAARENLKKEWLVVG